MKKILIGTLMLLIFLLTSCGTDYDESVGTILDSENVEIDEINIFNNN